MPPDNCSSKIGEKSPEETNLQDGTASIRGRTIVSYVQSTTTASSFAPSSITPTSANITGDVTPNSSSDGVCETPSVVIDQNHPSTLASSDQPRTTNLRKTQARKKTKSTSGPDLDISFLKRELATAQARIVQLDIEKSDKEKRIEILLARIKYYEEMENSTNYNKYYPTTQKSSCYESTCCDTRNLRCNSHQHQYTSPCQRPCDDQGRDFTRNATVAEILKRLESSINCMSETLLKFSEMEIIPKSKATVDRGCQSPSDLDIMLDDNGLVEREDRETDIHSESDSSIMSIGDELPESVKLLPNLN